eukprot:1001577-Rhodomonas_salina.3
MRFPENARDDVMMTTTMLGVMMTVIVMPMLLRLLLTMMLIDDAGSLWPRKCRWTKSRPSRIRFHPSRAFCGALRSGADVLAGCSVNDVLFAVLHLAVRRYLREKKDPIVDTNGRIRANFPINVRRSAPRAFCGAEDELWGTSRSTTFVFVAAN